MEESRNLAKVTQGKELSQDSDPGGLGSQTRFLTTARGQLPSDKQRHTHTHTIVPLIYTLWFMVNNYDL